MDTETRGGAGTEVAAGAETEDSGARRLFNSSEGATATLGAETLDSLVDGRAEATPPSDRICGAAFLFSVGTSGGTDVLPSYTLGCFFGATATIWLGNLLGRRKTIFFGSLIMIVGAAIQAASYGLPQLVVARFITGFGNGMNTSTVPMWQSETSKSHRRGRLVMIEGLYTFLAIPPWSAASELLDERWWIQIGEEEAERRLVERHVKTGVAKDMEEAVWRSRENDAPSKPMLTLRG